MSNVTESVKMLVSKMEDFVTTKTVVGEAVHIGNVILIPLVDVSFGMGSGAYDGDEAKRHSGGGFVGAKMAPSAVVVIVDGNVQLVNVKNQESVNKLIDMIPGVLSKFNLGSIFGKKKEKDPLADMSNISDFPDLSGFSSGSGESDGK